MTTLAIECADYACSAVADLACSRCAASVCAEHGYHARGGPLTCAACLRQDDADQERSARCVDHPSRFVRLVRCEECAGRGCDSCDGDGTQAVGCGECDHDA